MALELSYRLQREDDVPGLRRLWEQNTEWGPLSAEDWRQWYVETPHGPCLIVVAEDHAGEIAAQLVFTPSVVAADGAELPALRLSSPILRKDLRRLPLRSPEHPMPSLYRVGAGAAAARGYRLVYLLPQHSWLALFRLGPRIGLPEHLSAEYPCVGLNVSAAGEAGSEPAAGRRAAVVRQFGPEYLELWETARRELPIVCGVVRTPEWLRFRNGDNTVLELRDERSGALTGYAAVRETTGLLMDVLARNADGLVAVLDAARRWLGSRGDPSRPLQVMRTSFLDPALGRLGFEPVEFKFAFTCTPLDPALSVESVSPDRWHVMPGD